MAPSPRRGKFPKEPSGDRDGFGGHKNIEPAVKAVPHSTKNSFREWLSSERAMSKNSKKVADITNRTRIANQYHGCQPITQIKIGTATSAVITRLVRFFKTKNPFLSSLSDIEWGKIPIDIEEI